MVMIYGIGGIGMTTMAPNGLLMKAIMGAREDLAEGKISNEEWKKKLQTSQFDIPHWSHGNPFRRNYAQFMDSVEKPQVFAKTMNPMPPVLSPKGLSVMMRALKYIRL